MRTMIDWAGAALLLIGLAGYKPTQRDVALDISTLMQLNHVNGATSCRSNNETKNLNNLQEIGNKIIINLSNKENLK